MQFKSFVKVFFNFKNSRLFLKIQEYFDHNSFLGEFCKETTIHGFNHVVNKTYTPFERFACIFYFHFESHNIIHMNSSNVVVLAGWR